MIRYNKYMRILSLQRTSMRMLLHTALLICSVLAGATACEDGTLEAVEGTRCSQYAECEGGTWYLKECVPGQVFDSKTLKCAPVTNERICRNKVSKCSEGRTYSHPESRTMYYRCMNGRVTIQLCRVGEVFHPNSQHCNVDKEFQHPGLNRQKMNAEETCEEGSRRRNGKSCKDYVECVHGQEVNRTCADCMNYDDKSETCLFVFFSPCPYTPTPAPITTTTPQPDTTTHETKTEAPTTTPQPDTTTHETKTEAPTTTPQPDTTTESPTTTVAPCKEGDKIGIVDPNCVSYKECKHGVWVVEACSWSLKFDVIKKKCEYIWYNQITCAS